MTEKELMSELRSLRSDLGEYNDRLVQLRLEDFKSAFVAQMRDILAEEGRRTIGSGLTQARAELELRPEDRLPSADHF